MFSSRSNRSFPVPATLAFSASTVSRALNDDLVSNLVLLGDQSEQIQFGHAEYFLEQVRLTDNFLEDSIAGQVSFDRHPSVEGFSYLLLLACVFELRKHVELPEV